MAMHSPYLLPSLWKKGVRQGCLLSLQLFIALVEIIMRLAKEKKDRRIACAVVLHSMWNIKYADNTTLPARNKEDLKDISEMLTEKSL